MVPFFCRKPEIVTLEKSDSDLLAAVRDERHDVSILGMEFLNTDPKLFLLKARFAEPEVEFLDRAARVYSGRKTRSGSDRWPTYYSHELAANAIRAEWMLFEIHPDCLGAAERELNRSLK